MKLLRAFWVWMVTPFPTAFCVVGYAVMAALLAHSGATVCACAAAFASGLLLGSLATKKPEDVP